MKKYFILSDIHSFATPMKTALLKAGFNKRNKEHILICCGDLFDRGLETLEVYKFITSIPKSRRILVRGNHEYLYMELLTKIFPDYHDFSNGTVRTFCQIAGVNEEKLHQSYYFPEFGLENIELVSKLILDTWLDIRNKVANSPITDFIFSDEWKHYYEFNNFICVHSFIPVNYFDLGEKTEWDATYKAMTKNMEFKEDWRNSTDLEWQQASWGNPLKMYQSDLFNAEATKNKILICGHWNTSDFHSTYEYNPDDYSIFVGNHFLAIDACTALSKMVNVLVIENNLCFDLNNNLLEVNKNE